MGRARRIAACVLALLGVGAVLAVYIVTFGPGMPHDLAKALPPVTIVPRASEAASPAPPPINQQQPVSEFHPETIKIYKVEEAGQERDFVPLTDMDKGQLDVDGEGNVVHKDASGTELGPREAPGVVVHWSRSWPGTGTGTTEIDCHARVYPAMVCSPVMDMPEGTYGDESYRVELTGTAGQSLTYAIREVIVLQKADIDSRPELNENIKDRLLIYTCQVLDGQPIVSDRVVIATLISSKNTSAR